MLPSGDRHSQGCRSPPRAAPAPPSPHRRPADVPPRAAPPSPGASATGPCQRAQRYQHPVMLDGGHFDLGRRRSALAGPGPRGSLLDPLQPVHHHRVVRQGRRAGRSACSAAAGTGSEVSSSWSLGGASGTRCRRSGLRSAGSVIGVPHEPPPGTPSRSSASLDRGRPVPRRRAGPADSSRERRLPLLRPQVR